MHGARTSAVMKSVASAVVAGLPMTLIQASILKFVARVIKDSRVSPRERLRLIFRILLNQGTGSNGRVDLRR